MVRSRARTAEFQTRPYEDAVNFGNGHVNRLMRGAFRLEFHLTKVGWLTRRELEISNFLKVAPSAGQLRARRDLRSCCNGGVRQQNLDWKIPENIERVKIATHRSNLRLKLCTSLRTTKFGDQCGRRPADRISPVEGDNDTALRFGVG